MTNPANGDFESPVLLSTFNPIGYIFFWNPYLSEEVAPILGQGQSVVLSGPTSGSSLSDIDFSGFNLGQWITPAFTSAGSYTVNYDQVFTVVPEPSTSLLGLLGTALLFRRRRTS